MLAMKVMQLRRSPKDPGSPALIIPAGYFTMVPTNPLVCRTTDVSSMLITKGGRPSGAAANAKFIHWKKTKACEGPKMVPLHGPKK